MGSGETQLPKKWGRRREPYWKLKAAQGPGEGTVWMRPVLASRPGSALLQVSEWLRAGRTDAEVEKCGIGERRTQGSSPGRGATSATVLRCSFWPGRSHPRFARAGNFFPFAVGAAESVSSSPLLRQRALDGFAWGRGWGGGASHDRWALVKTLIAAFGAYQVSFPTCRFPTSKNPPSAALLQFRVGFKGKSIEARNRPALESFGTL